MSEWADSELYQIECLLVRIFGKDVAQKLGKDGLFEVRRAIILKVRELQKDVTIP